MGGLKADLSDHPNSFSQDALKGDTHMLLLVGGGSCSGKTFFSRQLTDLLCDMHVSCTTLSTDLFYAELPEDADLYNYNFDTLDAVDTGYITQICETVLQGRSVQMTAFDFETHRRTRHVAIESSEVLILEGIFALSIPKLLQQSFVSVYIDTDDEIRYARRYRLYKTVLQQSDVFIDHKLREQAEPFYKTVIYPARKNADILFNGDKPFDAGAACLASYIYMNCAKKQSEEAKHTDGIIQ